MTQKEQMEILHTVYGENLPELASIYKEGAAVFDEIADNHEITPYLLQELFTPYEMRFVNVLPGKAKEVAEKLSVSTQEAHETLERLSGTGRLVDDGKEDKTYGTFRRAVTFRDALIGAGMRGLFSFGEHRNAYALMEDWIRFSPSTSFPLAEILEMRIIPKWNSIKDIPGVMYCENMKEIIEENLKKGSMAAVQCGCRAVKSYIDEGKYSPEHCEVFSEHDNTDGHCFVFEEFAQFMLKSYSSSQDKMTHERAMKLFDEAEQSTAIYSGAKTRQIANICTCCSCCCTVQRHERDGLNVLKPSRFRPECFHDKCVKCKLCISRCYYDAISLVDGKIEIDADLCKGCGNCVVKCPVKALNMKIVHDPDWIPDEVYVNDFIYNG